MAEANDLGGQTGQRQPQSVPSWTQTLVGEISPRDLVYRGLSVLFRNKRFVLTVFAVTLFTIVFVAFLITPKFVATAKILVTENPQQQLILFNELETPATANKSVSPSLNLVEMARSLEMAETIVSEFKLDQPIESDHPRDFIKAGFVAVLKSPITLARGIGIVKESEPGITQAEAIDDFLEKQLAIESISKTEIVNVTIWNPSPELAARIANRVAMLLVEKTRELVRTEASEVYEFTKVQVQLAERSLQEAEKQLQDFKSQEGIVALEDEQKLLLQRLDTSHSKHAETVGLLPEARARLEELTRQYDSKDPTVIMSTTRAPNPVVTDSKKRIGEHTVKLALATTFEGARGPNVVATRGEIGALEQRLVKEPEMVVANETEAINSTRQDLELKIATEAAEVAGLVEKEKALLAEVENLETQAAALVAKEAQTNHLERKVSTHEERFNTLQSRLLALEVHRLQRLGEYNIRVVDQARVPEGTKPEWPKLPIVIVFGVFISTLVSVTAPFTVEYMRDGFQVPKDAANFLELPNLGEIPTGRAVQDMVQDFEPYSER